VIMSKNDRGGIDGESFLDDLAGVNGCPVDGTAEQLVKAQDSMPVVEKQAAKELVIEMPHTRLQEGLRVRRATNRLSAGKRLRVVTAGEFRQRSQDAEPRTPDTSAGQQLRRLSVQHGAQATEAPQKLHGRFARRDPATGTNQGCQQLSVAQSFVGLMPHDSMVMVFEICLQRINLATIAGFGRIRP